MQSDLVSEVQPQVPLTAAHTHCVLGLSQCYLFREKLLVVLVSRTQVRNDLCCQLHNITVPGSCLNDTLSLMHIR